MVNGTTRSYALLVCLSILTSLVIAGPARAQAILDATAATVTFDELLLPGQEPGCGYATFHAFTASGVRVQGQPGYTATALTAGVTTPQTYTGNLDSTGTATLAYCPPQAVGIDPLEVTFTATVGVATGAAVRIWAPDVPVTGQSAVAEVDPADALDDIWETNPLPGGLDCDASVDLGPTMQSNGLVKAIGSVDCHQATLSTYISICLRVLVESAWESLGCRDKFEPSEGQEASDGRIGRTIKEPCVTGAHKYKVRVWGSGTETTGNDKDAARQYSGALLCPTDGPQTDALTEYAINLAGTGG